jgi:septal ring factor EnvC (AmiA/AmiB activator)
MTFERLMPMTERQGIFVQSAPFNITVDVLSCGRLWYSNDGQCQLCVYTTGIVRPTMVNGSCVAERVMFETVAKFAAKIPEFLKRLADLEDDTEDTRRHVDLLRKELDVVHRNLQLHKKISDYQGKEIADFESRIAKLESEKRSLAIKAGIAKAKAARLAAAGKH